VACDFARDRAAVFRFYANASMSGTLRATSCGSSSGDPVLSVLSAPTATGGPYTCVGCVDRRGRE
jgi:hypothetical protein